MWPHMNSKQLSSLNTHSDRPALLSPTMTHLVILLIIAAFLSFTAGQTLSSTAELAALYSLRASLSLRASDWPRGADPCSRWTGVSCDAAGRIISLNLHGLRRTRLGHLNPRFAVDGLQKLSFLTSFNATGFTLHGQIPAWFGRPNPRLAVIDLSHASVSGEIPSSLGNLFSLVSLDLSHNLLTGALPDSLKNLKSLKNLNLGSNLLTGSVKIELFSNLTKLEYVTLSRNKFSGLIPASILSSPALKFLDVSANFTGNLPDLSAAKFSHNGIAFDLSHNLMHGPISSELAVLFSRFNSVDISDNYFQGSAPFDGNNNRNLSIGSNCFLNASAQRSTAECEQFYSERGIPYDGKMNSSAALTPTPSFNSSKSKKSWKYVVLGVVSGTALLVFLVFFVVLFIKRRRVQSVEQGEMNAVASSAPARSAAQPPRASVKLTTTTGVTSTNELGMPAWDFEDLIMSLC